MTLIGSTPSGLGRQKMSKTIDAYAKHPGLRELRRVCVVSEANRMEVYDTRTRTMMIGILYCTLFL